MGARKPIRCCGRFAFWRLPFGPWLCTECDRQWPGPMPRNAHARFWEAIDAQLAQRPEPWSAEEIELLRLFYVRPPTGVL